MRRSPIDRPSYTINPLIANYRSITAERERVRVYAWERDGLKEGEGAQERKKERERKGEREIGQERKRKDER